MNVTFPSTRLSGVERCARAIIAPEGFPDREACRFACVATVRELAAKGLSNSPPILSPLMTRERYQRAVPIHQRTFWKLDVGYQIRRRDFGFEVVHLSLLFPRVTARAHVDASRIDAQAPCAGCREFVPVALDGGLSLLRVLLPAFQSGARRTLQCEPQHTHVARLFELVADAALGCAANAESAGTYTASTPLPLLWPEPTRLNEEMRRLEAALPPNRAGEVGSDVEEINPWLGRTEEREQCQCLGASFLLPRTLTDYPLILLSLKERPFTPGSDRTVGERFGLTARESAVAALLAERRSNGEIASALGISPHTASHHTEQVLAKLGLSSRMGVWQRISEDPLQP